MKDIFENLNRKTLLIAAAILILSVAIIVGIVILAITPDDSEKDPVKPDDETTEENEVQKVDDSHIDIDLTGDAELDPENTESEKEEGATVEIQNVPPVSKRSNGIDVSKWQGKIDWKKVSASGIDFAYIRIGYRGENGKLYRDENADYNIQNARDAGLLIGVYFFSTAINEEEAREEALWTLKAVKGYGISYPIVYDCEGFKAPSSRMYLLSAEERTDNALAFLKTVEDAGYGAMLYGAKNELSDNAYWQIERIDRTYKIWVAQYPAVTYPEKDTPDHNRSFAAWQYTNMGRVDGIEGNVDMAVCYFTVEEKAAKDPAKTPPKAPAPLTDEEKLYTPVNEKVTAKDIVNLRSSATTKSDILGTLKNGEIATRIGIGSNGWSKLSFNGATVYAISSYLTTDLSHKNEAVDQDIVSGNTFSGVSDSVTAKELVNLRALPTTSSEVVGQLKKGDFLERTAISDKGWSRLVYEGRQVYAVTSYLTTTLTADTEKVETDTAPPSAEGFREVSEEVTAKELTNLRTAPTTKDSEVVYALPRGEYVRRTGIHTNGWSRLEYNGQTVYAISSYLITREEAEENSTDTETGNAE
ncbi:MAG: SH3 domain-containing protein [Clostridia bacterium]|nr:SH3 domain-containing protein [Clostridia bacterium]